MLTLPENETSYWRDNSPKSSYPGLRKDLKVDVVVIGGGICGLTAAYLLTQSGLSVAVLEKNTIGSGTTGGTTGKVTSQHGLVYSDMKKQFGEKTARLYGEANQAAIERVEELIKKEKIDCGWQRDDNFVFTTEPSQVKRLKEEAKAASSLGLPASYESNLPLPFKISGAVKFAGQGKFNAQKYIHGLAAAVHDNGGFIFENSSASSIRDGIPCTVSTKQATVTAKNIIVATNVPAFPLLARGAYCVLEYPTTSYIIAGRTKKSLDGMYISPDQNHHSIYPVTFAKEKMLLIAGNDHIRGLGRPQERYRQLADYAERHFDVSEVKYKWSAWDYIAYDEIPLVGKVYPWSKNMYVATAFKKWGLTGTTVAAMILHDTLTGKENPWADVFDSMRTSPIKSIPRVAAQYIKKAFPG